MKETVLTSYIDPEDGKTYRSRHLARAHQAMADLHEAGLVDAKTMREFDRSCLTPVISPGPDDIRAIRMKEGVSQAVMATTLHVSPKTIEAWEAGTKKPSGLALKVLALVQKHGLAYLR